MTEIFITKSFPAYADLDRSIAKYPFDPRQTERLLKELGYTTGADGFFARGGERLSINFRQQAGDQTQREMSIITGIWRTIGIETTVSQMSPTQLRDVEFTSSFPGVYSSAISAASRGGIHALTRFRTPPGGVTLSRGNSAGWSSAAFDQIHDTWLTALDPGERNRRVVQMVKLLTEDVPFTTLFFNYNVSVFSAVVRGPDPKAFDTHINWNIEEWEMR